MLMRSTYTSGPSVTSNVMLIRLLAAFWSRLGLTSAEARPIVLYRFRIPWVLSRTLLTEKTSPGLSLIWREISRSGSSVTPVTFTSPTLNCGPSTTVIVIVTRAFSRSIAMSCESTRDWMYPWSLYRATIRSMSRSSRWR